MNQKDKMIAAAVIGVLLLAIVYSAAVRDDDDPDTPSGPTTIPEAADAYLAAPKVVTKADALHTLLDDGDATNDPFVLDIRSSTSYFAGHIPGAVNIPFTQIFDDPELLPDDQQIVVVCYTGHTASQITALLNMAGFDAIALKWGFNSWNGTVADHTFTTGQTNEYPVIEGSEPGVFPTGRCGGDDEDDEPDETPPETGEGLLGNITLASYEYLKAGKPAVMTAAALHDNLDDGDTSDDPFVLDIRSSDDYTAGHVPTAVNVGFKDVFDPENLPLLPTDQQIVIICYSGHTASQIMALLNIAEYDAVALKWGFVSWNYTLGGSKAFHANTDAHDYAVEFGSYNLRVLADEYLALGKAPATSAASLNTTLGEGNASNDPFILDIRSSTSYDTAHIEGAVNIPFKTVFEADNLALLPTDNQIVVVCYTGHTASQITALLNVADYDAIALKWGFEGWGDGGKAFNASTHRLNGALETNAVQSTVTVGPDEKLAQSVTETADDYLASPKVVITASTLNDTLNDGNASNDPFILDIRSSTSYDAGHVPGAVNIGFRSVFTEANFSLLPDDQQIVVVCYTGHTASQITALLNLNGLDALALKWGFEGWSDGGKAFTGSGDYATVAS